MEGIKMKSYELNPICNSTAGCTYCGNQQTCEKVVYPSCCGVPKRAWDLCDHTVLTD
jgi:hypothetical protein